MMIREAVSAGDLIALLNLVVQDRKVTFFKSFNNYVKWLVNAFYSNDYQIIVAYDEADCVGFLIWQVAYVYDQTGAKFHYIFVLPDYRKKGIADELMIKFMFNVYKSEVDWCKFNTNVLPKEWIEKMTLNIPSVEKFDAYYVYRTEESKSWFEETFKDENL